MFSFCFCLFGSCVGFDKSSGVQRWGLAALGTICSAEDVLAKRAVDAGGVKSVIWALGADVLSQVGALHFGEWLERSGVGWNQKNAFVNIRKCRLIVEHIDGARRGVFG